MNDIFRDQLNFNKIMQLINENAHLLSTMDYKPENKRNFYNNE